LYGRRGNWGKAKNFLQGKNNPVGKNDQVPMPDFKKGKELNCLEGWGEKNLERARSKEKETPKCGSLPMGREWATRTGNWSRESPGGGRGEFGTYYVVEGKTIKKRR